MFNPLTVLLGSAGIIGGIGSIFGKDTTLFKDDRPNGCVSRVKWLKYIQFLRRETSMTARFRFKDGSVYVAQEFVDGDADTMTISVNGITRIYEREEVVAVELVPRPGSVAVLPKKKVGPAKMLTSDILEGRVSAWKPDRDFGFIVAGSVSYYFQGSFVRDTNLLKSLDNGNTDQQVRFRVIKAYLIPGKAAAVEVLEMVSDNVRSHPVPSGNSHFAMGWRAKDDGRLDEAEREFLLVLQDPSDEKYLSAIKELAGVIDRRPDPMGAFDLLEKHRHEFPDDEQLSIDRMQILYLHRAEKYQEEIDLIDRLLKQPGIPPNQVRHYREQRRRASECLNRPDLIRKKDKLVGYLRDKGVTLPTCEKIDKFIDELLRGVAQTDTEIDDDDVLLAGLHRIVAWAREYARCAHYARQRECADSVRNYLDAEEKARRGKDSDWVLPNIVIPLMLELRDAMSRDLAAIDKRDVVLMVMHAEGEQYGLVDGRVVLRLSIKMHQEDSPTIRSVTIKTEDREKDSLVVFVADELRGGEEKIVDVAIEPTADEIAAGEGEVVLRIDYKRVYLDGHCEEKIFERPELQFIIRNTLFKPISPNPFEVYATGKQPTEKPFFVGRDALIDRIVASFNNAERGGVCYVLHGARRSGKTTVLKNCATKLPRERFCYITTSMLSISKTPGRVFRNWYDALTTELFCQDAASCACLDEERYKAISEDNVAVQLRYLCEWMHRNGKTLVVAIDEFTTLYEYAQRSEDAHEEVRDILRSFKALLESESLHVFMIGRGSMKQFRAEYSNEFAVTQFEALQWLTFENVKELAEGAVLNDRGESRFKDKTLELLYRYTAGLPLLTQKVCRALVDYLNARKGDRFVADDVVQTVRLLCDGGDNAGGLVHALTCPDFEAFFNFYKPGFDEGNLVAVYYKLANIDPEYDGWMDRDDVIETDEQRRALEMMHELDVVEFKNSQVRLKSKLFADWLVANPDHTREDFSE